MKLLAGLGNPGRRYEGTRHNLGFLIIDQSARQLQISVQKKLCDAWVGEGSKDGEQVLLIKPQTYMNRSGQSVKCLLDHWGVTAEDLVVIHDDLDLAFGRLRIRPSGGAGGHRGILSIMESLTGDQFYRVRVGIGRPPVDVAAVDFVLEQFTQQEAGQLGQVVSLAAEAVVCLLREGGLRAMEQFNRAS
ncbi:MAG: aminoacyl-tRNA hydrolase [Candidatus Binatia bacterium]